MPLCVLAVVVIVGYGGGSGTPDTLVRTFNLQSGYANLAANGYSTTFTVSGDCAGTFTLARGPATTTLSFEGTAALAGSDTKTLSFSNCTPTTTTLTGFNYFDSNFLSLGSSTQGGNWYVNATKPVIPSAVKIGDAGAVVSINVYTDSTKTVSLGRLDVSYVIEADTAATGTSATTAILNEVNKRYDVNNVLTSTEQDRYRMAANGALTPLSFDFQYSSGSIRHLMGN